MSSSISLFRNRLQNPKQSCSKLNIHRAGDGIMASIYICYVSRSHGPGSSPPRSSCFRKLGYATCVSPTCPASAAYWFIKGRGMCHHVYGIIQVKRRCVPLAGFCLFLYCLHKLHRDINVIQSINK